MSHSLNSQVEGESPGFWWNWSAFASNSFSEQVLYSSHLLSPTARSLRHWVFPWWYIPSLDHSIWDRGPVCSLVLRSRQASSLCQIFLSHVLGSHPFLNIGQTFIGPGLQYFLCATFSRWICVNLHAISSGVISLDLVLFLLLHPVIHSSALIPPVPFLSYLFFSFSSSRCWITLANNHILSSLLPFSFDSLFPGVCVLA